RTTIRAEINLAVFMEVKIIPVSGSALDIRTGKAELGSIGKPGYFTLCQCMAKHRAIAHTRREHGQGTQRQKRDQEGSRQVDEGKEAGEAGEEGRQEVGAVPPSRVGRRQPG